MSEFVTVYRGVVNPWECDIMGHLNIQFYGAKVADGMSHFCHALGLHQDLTDAGGITLSRRKAYSRYLGELHAGDILDIRAAVLAVDENSVDILAEIINTTTHRLSASFEMQYVGLDGETQQPVPWPREVRQRMTDLTGKHSDAPRPPTAGSPVPAYAGNLGETFVSSRGTINTWDCDSRGQMSFQQYYAIASDGIGPVRHRMGITRDIALAKHWGGVALEYDIRFLNPIASGDIYSLRTGLLNLGDKTFRIGHRFHNDSSGELVATFDIIACMCDLQARRAMTIPPEIRAQAETLMVEWPPIE